MAKRFKLRISKAVSSSFNSCRSKDPSTLPQDPVPSFFQHHQHHPRSSFKRHLSAALVTVDCRCISRNEDTYTSNDMISTTRSRSQEFKWQKEEKWHVVANNYDEDTTPRRKISYSSVSDESGSEILALPPPPPSSITEKTTRRSRKKKNKTRFRMSTSSADESGIFSSSETWSEVDNNNNEEEEETETLISSCNSLDLEYSTDSSTEFNQPLETIYETTISRRQNIRSSSSKPRVKHSKRSITRGINIGRRSSVSTTSSDDNELPPRLSTFKKLIPCNMDGKVNESFAIMKKSQDPYEDFKRSMMEMILEKQMFEKDDLEQLLQCFLSLNAKNYHGVIVEAFSEIWKALFPLNDHKNSARTITTHHNRHL